MDINKILHKIKSLYSTDPKFMREFKKDRKAAVKKEFGAAVSKALEKEFGNKKTIDTDAKKQLDNAALDTIAGGVDKSSKTITREREIIEENNRVLQKKKVLQHIELELDVDGNATIESKLI